jgi:DNA-binding transcriptional LysR family regulator
VAEELSFIRASRKLFLSQPALSSQIQKLEQELGVKLFERNRRNVEVTAAGTVFIEEARETLARATKAVERVQKAGRGEVGRLRIGFVSSAALEIVPSIVVRFRKKFPEVNLDMMNLRTSDQLQSLAAKTLDVGFLRLPAQHRDLILTVIHREVFVIVLPTTHAFVRKACLTLRDLRDEAFVSYGRQFAPGFFDSIIAMCSACGFAPNIVQETGEMYTAIALVAAGQGVAVLPRSVVLAQPKGVVLRPIAASFGVSEIALAYRKSDQSTLLDSFVSFAKKK